MRKLYPFLIALLLFVFDAFTGLKAQTVTVTGSGTADSYIYGPMYTFGTTGARYYRAVYIYPASLLTMPAGSTINELAFEKANAETMAAGPNFKIYLENTTATDWGTTSVTWSTAITSATLTYDNDPSSIVGSTAGWKTFTLSTPFVYSGGNLAILVEYTQPANSVPVTINWEYQSSATQPAFVTNSTKYSSGTSSLPTTAATSSTNHPNLQINYTPPPPCTGTPDPGNTLTTATSVCAGEPFTLSTQNIVTGSGITYQWQSSPDGVSYSNINGATGASLLTQQYSSNYYQVLVTCTSSGLSATSTPVQVNIPLGTNAVFETFDTYLPAGCWSEAQGILGAPTTFTSTTTSSWAQDDFGNVTSPVNDAARIEIWTTTIDEWLISPTYDLGTGGNMQMEFDLAMTVWNSTAATTLGADDKFAVLISTDNGATWTSANTLRSWDASTSISNTGEHIVIDLSGYSGLVRFAFYGESTISNADNNVYVDNFIVRETPACQEPSNPVNSLVTHNSARIEWTPPLLAPATYEIYLATTSDAPTSSTTPTATGIINTFYDVTGLTGNTTYYVWVRSNCGVAGTSLWSLAYTSFTTLCNPIVAPTSSPENFDTYLPNVCWSEAAGILGATTTFSSTTASDWVQDDFGNVTSPTNKAAKINIYSTTKDEWLISPSIDLGTSGNLQLEMDLAFTDFGNTNPGVWGADDKFVVVISTDNGTTWSSANILRQWDVNNPISNTGEHIVIDLSGYSGVVKFGFYAESITANEDNDLFLDNFEVKIIPACAAPTSLTTSNITSSGARVEWIAPAPAPASYEIYYSTSSDAPLGSATPNAVGIANTFFDITGLTANTTYYVWVRSNCSGTISDWVSLNAVFTTLCDPFATPIATPEAFDTYLPNACWSEAAGILANPTVFTSTTSSSWGQDDFGNVTSPVNKAARLNIYGTAVDEWLITPSYDLGTGGNLQMEFDLAFTDYADEFAGVMGPDDKFAVLISTDDGITWSNTNILREWTAATPISNTGEHVVIDLSAYTGVVKFAFYGESTIGSNGDNDLFVDNFIIKTIPACASPSSVSVSNITNNSARAEWVAPAQAPSSYDIYISTSNTAPTGGTTATATGITSTFYDMASLTGNTTYYVWVRSVCSGTPSDWTTLAASFTTLCDAVSTFSENIDAVSTPGLPGCWENVGTTGTVQTQTANNNTAPNTMYIYSSSTSNIAMVSMPKINNLGAGTHWLKFNIRANITANGIIEIGYLTTPGDQSSFVLIDTVKAGSTSYQERTIIPGVIATSAEYLAFRHTGSPANSILIDDVRWEAMPACPGAEGGTATASTTSFCDVGTPTLSATGYSSGAISTYQWQSSIDNVSFVDIIGATDPSTYTPAISLTTTTYYRLKVTCNTGTATDYSDTVTITINPIPTATISPAAPVVLCAPATQLIEVTATSAANPTYVWTKDGVTIAGATSATYTATTSGAYSVTVIDGNTSCSVTNSINIQINAAPVVDITPSAPSICEGAVQQLSTTLVSGTATIGTGTSTTTTVTPYKGVWGGSKMQVLYTAAELTAQGLVPGSEISTVGFNVTAFTSPYTYEGFTIKMGGTSQSSLTTTFVAGLATVYGPSDLTLTGTAPFTTSHTLTTPFVWDGTSNLVVEFCFNNGDAGATGKSASVAYTSNTGKALYRTIDNSTTVCSELTGTVSSLRPNIILNHSENATVTWSPLTGLFTDAAATVAYTGGNTTSVYAKPASTSVYTATKTITSTTCTNTGNVTVTVNAAPTITLGASPSVCAGSTTADLVYTSTAGSPDQYSIDFDAAAEAVGFVDVANATLTTSPIVISVPGAAAAGTYNATIIVNNNAASCNGTVSSAFTVTISPAVTAGVISGTSPIAVGTITTFTTNGTAGGSWSSTNTAVATVNPTTGEVTALTVGTTDITYTVNSGCGSPVSAVFALSVTAAPSAGVVNGTSPLCIGQTATYTSTGDAGGVWSSTNTAVATVDASTGLVTAVSVGTTDITYTVNSISAFKTLTVSPNVNAGTVTGTASVCIGSSVTLASNGDSGGSWSSSNTSVATVNVSTGEVTGVTAGTADITYTINTGCGSPVSASLTVTVNANVSAGTITGTAVLCAGASTTLNTNGTTGGTWSSSNTSVATVNAATGEVTAVAAGTTDITYTVSTGCGSPVSALIAVTVNANVSAGTVSGTSTLCVGSAATLSSSGTTGGTWSSSNTAVATVDAATGEVTAVASGTSDIIYTVSSGCGSPVSSQLQVTVVASGVWTGAVDSLWNTAGNWCGGVPTSTSDVTIPSGVANMPVIDEAATARNVTINTGGSLTVHNGGRLNLHGNFVNSGTVNATQGTVAFMGATAQTIDALVADTVIMDGAGGATLNGALSTGTLILTSGHITTGNHNMLINNSAAGSVASHIITSGTGAVIANNVGATTFIVPVGPDAATYNPVTLSNGQGLNYAVKVVTGITPAIFDASIAINRTWAVVPSATPASAVTIAFEYADAHANANANPAANMEVGVHNGTNWAVASPAGGIAPTGSASARVVSVQTTQSGAFVLSNIGGTTAVPNIDQDITSVKLMPNVVEGRSTLRVNVRRAMKIDWVVTDMNGRVVSRFSQQLMPGQTDLSLQLGHLANGSYQISGYTNKGKTELLKFIKL